MLSGKPGASFWMECVSDERPGSTGSWLEEVPDSLPQPGAPSLSGLGPVERAEVSIGWFNTTLRPHERPRKLLCVHKYLVSMETLFSSPGV